MAKKATTTTEQISEDIVEQELILPNEESPVEVPAEEAPAQNLNGHPSRDFGKTRNQ